MFEEYNDILTIEEMCEILMIGRNAAYSLLNKGTLKDFRIGKVWKIPKKSMLLPVSSNQKWPLAFQDDISKQHYVHVV